jgi:hypothetical protein
MVPETEDTLYDSHLLASAPKYFSTACFDNSAAIAPAMKKAGTKHVRTWGERYPISVSTPAVKITVTVPTI